MDFAAALQTGHSKKISTQIADYVGNNTHRFKQLIEVFRAGPYRITQRAAWPLSLCVQRHPDLITPHMGTLLEAMEEPGAHDAVIRNGVRLLQFVNIPATYHGKVADLCFRYLENKGTPVAIKAFSMTVLGHISQDHPELQRMLRYILEDQLPYGSPAFRSRANKILKSMRER